jgi:hypothetical protein
VSNDGEDIEKVVDMFDLSSDSDDIEKTNNGGEDNDNCASLLEDEHSVIENSSRDIVRSYDDIMQEKTPTIVRKIRSHKPDLRRILRERKAAPDCSYDSYPDEGVGDDMYCLSSDSDGEDNASYSENVSSESKDNENSESDGSGANLTETATSAASAAHLTAAKRRVVSDLFTNPKQNDNSLSQRIRKNREGIQKVGLKRRVQGIEDSFVLNTGARRSSAIANQARARTKLQKRIDQRKSIIKSTDEGGGGVKNDDQVDAPGISRDSIKFINNVDRPSSFKAFKEKKTILKNYTAHQSLREHSLEAQRQEAKAALKLRVSRKKNNGNRVQPE